MKAGLTIPTLLVFALLDASNAFSIEPVRIVHSKNHNPTSRSTLSLHNHVSEEVDKIMDKNDFGGSHFKSVFQTIQKRSNTFRAAGFYEDENNKGFLEPKTCGAKTNITLFFLALGYKWYRSVFINKVSNIFAHTYSSSSLKISILFIQNIFIVFVL